MYSLQINGYNMPKSSFLVEVTFNEKFMFFQSFISKKQQQKIVIMLDYFTSLVPNFAEKNFFTNSLPLHVVWG